MRKHLPGILACVFLAFPVHAEDINAIFKRVNDSVESRDYSKALEELDWAKKEIEKLHVQKLQEFFPEKLEGFIGQKFDSNSVLGFSNVERDYTQGKKSVKVSLTGGTGQGAAALSGLAQLGKMAAMFGGNVPGNETVRIKGRTSTVESMGGSASVTVMLDSGSILRLESASGVKAEDLKGMAEAIKIDEMDVYLKGVK